MGVETDADVGRAVERIAQKLSEMGHRVSEESPEFDGPAAMRSMTDVWFFGFNLRLEGYAKRTGRPIGPDTLEPVVLEIYEYAKRMTPAHFLNAMAAVNHARRRLGRYFAKYDVWLSPTTPNVAQPWGTYNLARTDVTMKDLTEKVFAGTCSFTLPYNVTGTPAISLPLAMHSSGLPIGIQLGSRPASEHVVLQIAARLEEDMPWNGRVPPLHAGRLVN
jgi:amidase